MASTSLVQGGPGSRIQPNPRYLRRNPVAALVAAPWLPWALGLGAALAVLRADHELQRGQARWLARQLSEVSGKPILSIGAKCDPFGDTRCDLVPSCEGVEYCDAENLSVFGDKQFGVAFCLTPESVVIGDNKEIREIGLGDRVMSMAGYDQRIKETFKRSYVGPAVAIRALGVPAVTLTPDHAVLTTAIRRRHIRSWHKSTRGARCNLFVPELSVAVWKRACDVSTNDYLLVPRRKTTQATSFTFARRTVKNQYGESSDQQHVSIDPEVAEMLGLYVAEGCTTRNGRGYLICLTFGIHERALAERWCQVVREKLHINARVSAPPSRTSQNGLNAEVSSKGLHTFLAAEFGKGATEKRVSSLIKDASPEVIRAFIRGIWAGDGNVSGSTVDITTASRHLAFDLMELLYKIGITPSLYPTQVKATVIKGRAVAPRLAYRVHFPLSAFTGNRDKANRQPYLRAKVDDDFVYLPVWKTTQIQIASEVHNLHTEDETFSVPFVVHNCSHVLEHVQDPQEAVRQASRVADNVVAVMPTALHPEAWLYWEHRWQWVGENPIALGEWRYGIAAGAVLIGLLWWSGRKHA